MSSHGGHRAGTGQILIHSPQESKRREFMRNSTYGVIEVQAASLLPRIEVHLRILFLPSRLNVRDHNIVVS